MASNSIETAPKNEELIGLLGESGDVFEIARWSVKKGNWVGQEGEPIRIKPTHWFQPNPSWLAPNTSPRGKQAPRGTRFGLYAAAFVTAGLAILFPAFIGDFEPSSSHHTHRAGETPTSTASVPAQTVLRQDVASAEMANFRTVSEAPPSIETAKASNIEQKQGLDQARLGDDAVVYDLASAGQNIEALLQDRVDRATAALNAARTETAQTLQTAQVSASEQKDALDKERQRGDALARQLASAREEVEARKAAERAAGDAVQKAQTSAGEQKDALEKERQRGDALARDLVSVREEVEALKARVAAATAGHIEAAHSLQAARAEVEALKARVAAAIVVRTEPTQFVQAAHASSQAAPQAAAPPPTTGVAAVSPASVGRGSAADPQTAADTASSVGRGDSAAAPAREPAAVGDRTRAAAPLVGAIEGQIALWVKRGQDFIAVGDFASARMVFQRAAEAGDAQAALMLGGTYDPNVLDRFRTKGLAADIAKARLWYEKARALGSPEAPRRLELLAQSRR